MKKLSSQFSSPTFHLCNTVLETRGEKPAGSRAALKRPDLSPGVLKTELWR
jgi:hypothetical protein